MIAQNDPSVDSDLSAYRNDQAAFNPPVFEWIALSL